MSYKIRVERKGAILPVMTLSEKWTEWVVERQKQIGYGVGILFVLLLVIGGGKFYLYRAEEKVKTEVYEAFALAHLKPDMQSENKEKKEEVMARQKKALALYQDILKNYVNVPPSVQYEIANLNFELKEYDTADKEYELFLTHYPKMTEWIPLAQMKRGYIQQIKGNQEAARKEFQKTYEIKDGVSQDFAGYEMARSLEGDNKKEEAIKLFKKISEDYKESAWGTEAKARLLILEPPVPTTETSSQSVEPVLIPVSTPSVTANPAPMSPIPLLIPPTMPIPTPATQGE